MKKEWGWHKSVVVIKTNLGYFVPIFEYNVNHVLSKSISNVVLNVLPDWNKEEYPPDLIERGGYWYHAMTVKPNIGVSNSLTAEFSMDGKFKFCEENMRQEECSSFGFGSTSGMGWENSLISGVDNRCSQSYSFTCANTFTCDDADRCYIFQWVTFVRNLQTGQVKTMQTCEMRNLNTIDLVPQCVPYECNDRNCQ